MAEQPEPHASPTSDGPAGQIGPTAGSRRPIWPYVAIAVVALAVGVGATVLVLRSGLVPSLRMSPPAAVTGGDHAGVTGQLEAPTAEPPSDQAIFISASRQQLIGVRTAEIASRELDATLRTVGVLAYDETHVAEVHTKIAGWLESVPVDFVGKPVHRGQTLFTVYSPDLVLAQKEYLLALKQQQQLGASPQVETRDGAASMLVASREKLRLWDVTDAQVAELERTREPRRTLSIYSPFDGIVLERNAFPGQYITPEMRTFKIADLSTIWVLGQIFEYELPFVKIGQEAEIQFPHGSSSDAAKGRITFIYPDVDAMTRRVKVRVELKNPGFEFKPDSYVTVLIRTGGGRRLAVPKEAVIDNGDKRYVILALAHGYFEPRVIQVGEPMNDFYPVLTGIRSGDRVVTSAQFLIDSETNLQAAMQAMATSPADAVPAPPAQSAGTPTPTAAARLAIALATQPATPRLGENVFEVTVKDAEGRPTADATVSLAFYMPPMPSMGMPAMRSSASLAAAGGGVYRGTVDVPMAGTWQVTVTVSRAGQTLGTKRLAVVVQ